MFFKGIYRWHLTAILALLVVILLVNVSFITTPRPVTQFPANVSSDRNDYTIDKPKQVTLYYSDYVLRIQDDHTLVMYDIDGRIVNVFNRSYEPNSHLFHVVDNDNE